MIASRWGRKGKREIGEGGTEKSDTFWAYLHIAASMTGNLGKFSTEPAADGRRVRTKRESSKREKEKGGEGGQTCADYLTRLELALRVWQQMAFQIPIRGVWWDSSWRGSGVKAVGAT